jgi:hypothetical protein
VVSDFRRGIAELRLPGFDRPVAVGLLSKRAHMVARPSDDDGQFAFEIELVGNAGAHQRLAVTDEGIGEAYTLGAGDTSRPVSSAWER